MYRIESSVNSSRASVSYHDPIKSQQVGVLNLTKYFVLSHPALAKISNLMVRLQQSGPPDVVPRLLTNAKAISEYAYVSQFTPIFFFLN